MRTAVAASLLTTSVIGGPLVGTTRTEAADPAPPRKQQIAFTVTSDTSPRDVFVAS